MAKSKRAIKSQSQKSVLQGLNLDQPTIKEKQADHIIVEALAGTGKTFTLIVGVAYMFREEVPELWTELSNRLGREPIPSDQQVAIWESMKLSSKTAKVIKFAAFNKSIVEEFETKWGWVCKLLQTKGVNFSFSTMHSTGYAAIRKAYGNVRVNQYKTSDILCSIINRDPKDLRRENGILLTTATRLVSLCKLNLVGNNGLNPSCEDLENLCREYDIDFSEARGGTKEQVFQLVPKILEQAILVKERNDIDFDDMVWLPIVLDLAISKSDIFLGDEVQDWNRVQQQLAIKSGKRLVLCGDPNQAIYGFAGADTESMNRLRTILNSEGNHCSVFPLTVTYRCGKAIVEEVKSWVPGYTAHESNPKGSIKTVPFSDKGTTVKTYRDYCEDGDMVLCRINAPLVSQCLWFLKNNRKAFIQGRDIAQKLISTVKKQKAIDIKDLIGKLGNWMNNEIQKELNSRNPNEARMIMINDLHDCILSFTESLKAEDPVQVIIDRIDSVFSDDTQKKGIRLSSVHKAKGLEANRVFILLVKGASFPHPMCKSEAQRKQDMNLLYVARTRAINELVYVKNEDENKEDEK